MLAAASLIHSARRQPLLWVGVMFALLVWKAALPWLAASAAQQRGLLTAEVCSVYGVRTVVVAEGPAPNASRLAMEPGTQFNPFQDSKPDSQGQVSHSGGDHCTLSSLIVSAGIASPQPSVLLHAPADALAVQPDVTATHHPDAVGRWISRRTHAPPPAA